MITLLRNYPKLLRRGYCTQNEAHIPVMVNEVLKALKPQEGETYIDMTFGAGGHCKKILEENLKCRIIALDRDPEAYKIAVKMSKIYPNQIIPLLGKFSDLPDLLKEKQIGVGTIDGFLFDLGCSSMQFDLPFRGFSLSKDGPLDMRMDGQRFPENPTAADVLEHAEEQDIFKILRIYGEEKYAKKITNAIIETRYTFKKLKTTHELATLVDSVFETDCRTDKLGRRSHNATKTFQALRIFVNNELNELNYGLILADHYLKLGGKLITLSFHSLEDLIIKRHLSGHMIGNTIDPVPLKYSSYDILNDNVKSLENFKRSHWESIYKHVLVPSKEEVECNPRSRSAKLRAAIKVE